MELQELYNHITKHLTAEQALRKLLEGHLLTYEKLKFQEGEEIHPAMLIAMAALDMGWDIAIPDNNGDDDMELIGMVVGTDEYIKDLFKVDDCCNKCDGKCSCDHSEEEN